MKGIEFEQAVLTSILKEPGAARRVFLELQDDRFASGITQDIYKAMLEVYSQGKPLDILSVVARMDIKKHPAAQEYLIELNKSFFKRMGIHDLRGLDDWVRFVDNIGRLRQAGLVLVEYATLFEDFNNLIGTVDDPDAFLGDMLTKLRLAQGNTKGGFESMDVVGGEVERHLERSFAGEVIDRLPTGWASLDTALAGGIPKGLVVLCGLPSMGKTALALQLAAEMCKYFDQGCVAINSLEMKAWRLYYRLACAYAEVDSRAVSRGDVKPDSPEAIRLLGEVARLKKLPLFIDESDLVTSSVIDYQASALHAEHGPLKAIIIDYAELVKQSKDEDGTEEQRVSGIYRKAHSLSKQMDCSVILLSQYSRAVTMRNNKLGTNFDIRYSGAAEAAAHSIWHIYNPYQMRLAHMEVDPPSDLPYIEKRAHIVVGKDKDAGAGSFMLGWNPTYTKWFDPPAVTQFGADENEF